MLWIWNIIIGVTLCAQISAKFVSKRSVVFDLRGINSMRLHARLSSGSPPPKDVPASQTKGFGRVVRGPSISQEDVSLVCPCCSGLSYLSCCRKLHEFAEISSDPIAVARARYSAFALGKPDFIIDSTHFEEKDYKKYREGLDIKKSKKQWGKDIVNGNSKEFDFLKFDILNSPLISADVSEKLSQWENSVAVTFRFMIRKRNDKTVAIRKETSIYRQRDIDSDELLTLSESPQKLLFAHGVVCMMDKAEADEFSKGIK